MQACYLRSEIRREIRLGMKFGRHTGPDICRRNTTEHKHRTSKYRVEDFGNKYEKSLPRRHRAYLHHRSCIYRSQSQSHGDQGEIILEEKTNTA